MAERPSVTEPGNGRNKGILVGASAPVAQEPSLFEAAAQMRERLQRVVDKADLSLGGTGGYPPSFKWTDAFIEALAADGLRLSDAAATSPEATPEVDSGAASELVERIRRGLRRRIEGVGVTCDEDANDALDELLARLVSVEQERDHLRILHSNAAMAHIESEVGRRKAVRELKAVEQERDRLKTEIGDGPRPSVAEVGYWRHLACAAYEVIARMRIGDLTPDETIAEWDAARERINSAEQAAALNADMAREATVGIGDLVRKLDAAQKRCVIATASAELNAAFLAESEAALQEIVAVLDDASHSAVDVASRGLIRDIANRALAATCATAADAASEVEVALSPHPNETPPATIDLDSIRARIASAWGTVHDWEIVVLLTRLAAAVQHAELLERDLGKALTHADTKGRDLQVMEQRAERAEAERDEARAFADATNLPNHGRVLHFADQREAELKDRVIAAEARVTACEQALLKAQNETRRVAVNVTHRSDVRDTE